MSAERFAVALDVGGTFIKGALIEEGGQVLERIISATEKNQGYGAVMGKIKNLIGSLQACIPPGGFWAGVGLGVAGWTDPLTGMVRLAPNLGWRDVKPLEELKDTIAVPIILDNDANLAALGEFWQGAGQNQDNFLMLTIGTGVGSGLILGGKLYRGFTRLGPELGHLTVDPGGTVCRCGRRGCLETLVGARAIIRLIRERARELPGTGWWSDLNLTVKEVFLQAEKEEVLAKEVVEEAAFHLARGLANLALILDLPLVIIGGGIGQAGPVFLEPLKKYLRQGLVGLPQKLPEIRAASLGNEAGLFGAAGLVFRTNSPLPI